jgi:hypothetical protein
MENVYVGDPRTCITIRPGREAERLVLFFFMHYVIVPSLTRPYSTPQSWRMLDE